MHKHYLAFETSCDDTSVAIVRNDGHVVSMSMASQDDFHAPFGGVVPEIAARNHSFVIQTLVEKTLHKAQMDFVDLSGIAVTNRPGLVGALIVGVVTAKTLSQVTKLPLLPVNHLEGHILAPLLFDEQIPSPAEIEFPVLVLAVSGGHTSLYKMNQIGDYQVLGTTRDDAAGECIDKFAKTLGLGFPGGVQVDKLSQTGDRKKYSFPLGLPSDETLDFSFSGIKAAGQRQIAAISPDHLSEELPHLCASYQEAVVQSLLRKLKQAHKVHPCKTVFLTGGVAANSCLRTLTQNWCDSRKLRLLIPPPRYCTDNAAMIGLAGAYNHQRGLVGDLMMGPSPSSLPGDFHE